jgi:hypothetical protein
VPALPLSYRAVARKGVEPLTWRLSAGRPLSIPFSNGGGTTGRLEALVWNSYPFRQQWMYTTRKGPIANRGSGGVDPTLIAPPLIHQPARKSLIMGEWREGVGVEPNPPGKPRPQTGFDKAVQYSHDK